MLADMILIHDARVAVGIRFGSHTLDVMRRLHDIYFLFLY